MSETTRVKSQQIVDLEIREAKEQFAEFYIQSVKVIEESHEPFDTLKQIIEPTLDNTHSQIQEVVPEHNIAPDDLEKAIRLLAEKELKDHHRDEIETLCEREATNPNHISDLAALHVLHNMEEQAFNNSTNPLEETRAIIHDSDRFESFEDYALSRLEEAKAIAEMQDTMSIHSNSSMDHEEYLRAHLQDLSIKKEEEAIERPPMHYGQFFPQQDWHKQMMVEGTFAEYSSTESIESHSIDWQSHNFQAHHIHAYSEVDQSLSQSDDFSLSE